MSRFERAALTGTTERERKLEAEVEQLRRELDEAYKVQTRLSEELLAHGGRLQAAEAQVAELREPLTVAPIVLNEIIRLAGRGELGTLRATVDAFLAEVARVLASSTGEER